MLFSQVFFFLFICQKKMCQNLVLRSSRIWILREHPHCWVLHLKNRNPIKQCFLSQEENLSVFFEAATRCNSKGGWGGWQLLQVLKNQGPPVSTGEHEGEKNPAGFYLARHTPKYCMNIKQGLSCWLFRFRGI